MARRGFQSSLLVALFTAALLVTSGCIRLTVQTTVNPDGSGTREIETVLDRSLSDLAQLSGESSATAFEQQLRDALPPNATLRIFTKTSERHYVARFAFASIADLNKVTRGDSRRTGPTASSATMRSKDNLFFVTYEYAEYLPPLSEPLTPQESSLADKATVEYRLTLPGTILSSDADNLAGASTGIWRVPLLKGRKVRATSRTINWPVVAGAVAAAVVIIICVAIGIVLLRRRLSKKGGSAEAVEE